MNASTGAPFGRRATGPLLRPRVARPTLPQPLWTMDFVRFPTLAAGQGRPALSFSRASPAFDPLRGITVAADEPRFNAHGLLIEGRRRNYLHDSASPATQTRSLGAGTYTLWLEGSGTVALSGGPSGTASAGSPATFTLAAPADVTFTAAGTVDRFQCETDPDLTSAGLFASSFIATPSDDGATREADLVSTSDVSWFNPAEGTFSSVVSFTTSVAELVSLSTAQGIFTVSDGGATNRIDLNRNGNSETMRFIGTRNSSDIFLIDDALVEPGSHAFASAYRSDDSVNFVDGNIAETDSLNITFDPISTLDLLSIGNRFNQGNFLFGYVAKFAYWPYRIKDASLSLFSST
jgi:hypothetical protein